MWFSSQRTSETHKRALSGLLPQSFHILIVDVNKVDRLETECFGGDHHFLPGIQEFFSIFSACGSCRLKDFLTYRFLQKCY